MESALPGQSHAMPTKEKEEEDEENEEVEDSEASSSNEDEESMKKAVQALTCRKVTLNMLMEDGLIEAGNSVLTIDYLGQRFEADLLPSGKIKWHGSEEEFGTPSAWALHCKRLVNPIKRSGCGWASVRYKNKKLDIWKSIWARKQRLSSSSKSPQISPGSRLSSSSSVADQAGHSPGLASPTGLRGVAGPTRLVSPPSCSSTGVSISSATTTTTTSSTTSSITTPQSPPAVVSVASDDAKSTPASASLSSPLSSSPSSSVPVPKIDSEGLQSSSDHKPTQIASAAAGSESQAAGDQDSSKATEAALPDTEANKAPSGDVQLGSTLAGSGNPSSSHTLPQEAGDGQSPSKKARKDDAILQQPVKASQAQLGLERGSWDGFQQHHQSHTKRRTSVPYSSLGQRGLDVDPFTLIKCENFDSLSKIQPFTVSISSNSLLLMDFHCHLTKSEVVGYLGGRWDCQRQHLSIEQAFPAKCRLGDKDRSTIVEDEIRRSMCQKGMMVVGWYHSHPTCPPDPSLRDLDCQMAYQLRMRGSGAIYLPCVGFILSPFEKFPPKQDSKIQAYWVMPNLEHPTSFNIPMHVTHSVVRDVSLTEDLLADMKSLCEFYSGAVDKIRLREQWGEAITYMDKIKASLRSKLPQDQLDSSTFLDYVQQLLGDMK
ncbi:hypothetical protein RRG08_025682 [Elysia crispata]|uniref:MPN domain-containing protein n=1 Tax=Elysia crispata TaxID=231223 RepID=A0AAE1E639_9GAST|nr:hypothetical protein RRG08_025682 [Elysia crispata]